MFKRHFLVLLSSAALAGLAACGIGVEGREAHQFEANGVNDAYLETKARRFGHLLA